ncbi:hypothetical protein [Photorhabdus stackebrandtii]|nr:hypothetical protein [Photorhabdus stackebrandtii]
MIKKYRSNAFAAIHETMEELGEIGVVNESMKLCGAPHWCLCC